PAPYRCGGGIALYGHLECFARVRRLTPINPARPRASSAALDGSGTSLVDCTGNGPESSWIWKTSSSALAFTGLARALKRMPPPNVPLPPKKIKRQRRHTGAGDARLDTFEEAPEDAVIEPPGDGREIRRAADEPARAGDVVGVEFHDVQIVRHGAVEGRLEPGEENDFRSHAGDIVGIEERFDVEKRAVAAKRRLGGLVGDIELDRNGLRRCAP
ncbi:MAG: hypothetical protein OXT06_00275, partial [Rhodospirillaceae bacterium]|nr:hypothetical protein [Rhodospirillaceae bacterium]